MSIYELRTKEFNGPLDKLLQLIEDRKLEITKINLAEVTADFVSYLKNLQNVQPKVIADFVSVASKMILIKSHTLLPGLELTENEQGEIYELENKLKLYKEFKEAQRRISNMWAKKISYGRDFLMNFENGFYLSQIITPNMLESVIKQLAGELEIIFPKIEEKNIKLVNFEEKMKELMDRVSRAMSSSFNEISKGKDRTEIVVLFLAILHLLRDSLIKIEQKGEFEDIKIEKRRF